MMKIKKIIKKYFELPLGVKATLWFLICNLLEKGISIFTTPIFTRLLNTNEYGEFNIFNSWVSLLTIFISLNLYSGVYSQGLVKNSENREEYASSLQGLSLTLAIIWGIIFFILKDPISNFLKISYFQLFMLLIIIWTTSSFNFWATKKRVELDYKKLIFLTMLIIILKPILGILFVIKLQNKVNARILSIVVINLIFYSLLFICQIREGKKFYIKKYWVSALKFNVPLIPHYLSGTILSVSDRIMIGRMVGDDKAGIYSLAYSLSMVMIIFNSVIFQTLEPWLYKKLKENQTGEFSKIMYPSLIGIAILNLIVIGFAPEIIKLFAPEEYYEAVWIIPPVAMSVYFMFSYTFFAVFEFYYEKPKYIAFATAFAAVLNIVLNYIGIKKFGYLAAGYATLICYIIYSGMHYFFMRKICKNFLKNIKVYDLRKLMIISGIFINIALIFLSSYNNIILRYILILLLFGVNLFSIKKIKKYIYELIYMRKNNE